MSSDSRGIIPRAAAEAIGTFFLVLIGPGSSVVNAWSQGAISHAGVALSFGFVVAAMVYAIGSISGAHINPAVTIGLWTTHRFPLRDVAPYVIAQCIGAIAAAYLLRAILGGAIASGATASLIPPAGAFAVEFLLSFVLMFVIMAVITGDAGNFGFLAIGMTVAFCAMMGGPLTGASMNPARTLGPALAGGVWAQHWVYWAAPILGMVAAVHAYAFVSRERVTTPPPPR